MYYLGIDLHKDESHVAVLDDDAEVVEEIRVNADDLQSVAADNGFQDWHSEYEIAAHDVEYLVHYRGSSAKAAANNTLNRANGYAQRWMAETSYSTTKRSLGDVVRALSWYRQFREIVLMFAIINIEPLCEPLQP